MITTQEVTEPYKKYQTTYLIIYSMNLENISNKNG